MVAYRVEGVTTRESDVILGFFGELIDLGVYMPVGF